MKLKDLFNFGNKSKSYQDLGGGQFLGTHIVGNSLYAHYTDDLYENGYSSIRAIANRFMTLRPYAIDNNGKRVDNKNVINVLARPSKDFSGLDFRDVISVFYMVAPKTFLLVWEKKGKVAVPASENVREDNIAGFTILENVSEIVQQGKVSYQVYENGSPVTYYPYQVMTFYGINPNDLSKGYSPSRAARRWSSIDDYIADYQNGFFRNGAIPAGQFIITASTPKEFNDEVDNLEAKHKGAGKNNNIVYVHRPVDQNDGKPSTAKIEWVPFNTPNKDMALDKIFDQANKKIDSVFGVSAFIRAIDEAPNFATAQVIERNFVENTVRPFALKLWTRFSHELNRITGGLGYAITFDLETPGIAEEEKLQAETDKIIVDTITLLVDDKGYTLDSTIEAMKLPDNWKLLKKATEGNGNDAEIDNDKPEVDDGNEVDGAPEQAKKNAKIKQVSARDYPTLYEGLDINPDDLGCIMADTKPMKILSVVGKGAEDDLAETVTMDRTPVPAEEASHITLLYGLLENGNVWKEKVDAVLGDFNMKSATIEEVGYFNLPDSYAIVAHIKKTTDLQEAHDRLTLLPHINTFSDYRPHLTLAYIKKEADLGKWLTTLAEKYNGKEISITGINYGDQPDSSEKGAAKAKTPKALDVKQKNLTATQTSSYEKKVEKIASAQMKDQIESAITTINGDASKAIGDPTVDQIDKMAEEMTALIVQLMNQAGGAQTKEGRTILENFGVNTSHIRNFAVNEVARQAYLSYITGVSLSYSTDTANSIKNVLTQANSEGLTRAELEKNLRGIMQTDKWRVTRLGVTEVNTASSQASVIAMQDIQSEADVRINKVWTHFGGDAPCEFCAAWIGTKVNVSDNYIDKGSAVTGVDGGTMMNNWRTIGAGDIHPNGHCGERYEVEIVQ